MRRVIFVVFALLLLASCGTQREWAYVTDAERDSAQQILQGYANTIHPGDQLYIYVNSMQPEGTIPFNQEAHVMPLEMTRVNTSKNNRQAVMSDVQGYIVTQEGEILFPLLGKMRVAGITYDSLQALLQQRLRDEGYVIDATVTVSLMNFRVSVMGEVARPRELHVVGDRLTLLEALAMCGDITMDGLRENVVVMRMKNGVATPIEVDLTKKSLFDSEAYYLQQDDVVYVEPSDKKKRVAMRSENWPKYLTTMVAVAHVVWLFSRVRYYYNAN